MIPESLANDFHQDSFFSAPVKLTIKNLFPRTEIQLSLGHRNDNLTPHDRSFQMSIAVIFTGINYADKDQGADAEQAVRANAQSHDEARFHHH